MAFARQPAGRLQLVAAHGPHDYFQLPDLGHVSPLSGKAVTFSMPDEPWNHLEISGAAWDRSRSKGGSGAVRAPEGQERTSHQLAEAIRGRSPLLQRRDRRRRSAVCGVSRKPDGKSLAGISRLRYRLTAAAEPACSVTLADAHRRPIPAGRADHDGGAAGECARLARRWPPAEGGC